MALTSDLTETIVQTVADYENVSPEDLPPLQEKIDSETLRQLEGAGSRLSEPLEFSYVFYEVTVEPGGEVSVTP